MKAGSPPRIFVSAGEPSGDAHAAAVVRALRRRWPAAVIDAFGGPALEAEGATVRFPMERYTVIGFFEVLGKIPAHWRLLRELTRDFRAGRYDLVIPVDYPGFNIRLSEAARRAGVRSLYYIAPQLWAWRPGRARRFAAAVDGVAVILPFEPEFFRRVGIHAEFVGHPLVEQARPDRSAARSALGLGAEDRAVAVFPGSREQEVARLWPLFRETTDRLRASGALTRVLVADTGNHELPASGDATIVRGNPAMVLAAADAALVKSGTTTLEAALADTPMVVSYRVHPVTAAIARRVMTVQWISLVNLVAGRAVVPEIVQWHATPETLAAALAPLFERSGSAAVAQRAGLAVVRERLGVPGAADRVADMAEAVLAA
jgi:lipid-A-disaccharide synthase